MLGAIAGDIIGSVYERNPVTDWHFPLFGPDSHFTDDTVLTVAVAHSLLHEEPFSKSIREYACRYPLAGYGGTFRKWMAGLIEGPYNSWGNGSAMRVSSVGFACDDRNEVIQMAKETAEVTHNHPEGIKGAQAVALAIFMARSGYGKKVIQDQLESVFAYDLSTSLSEIQPDYSFDVSCQGSVPQSIIAFLESECWEDAVRNAIWLGGDSDTMACIAGAIAEAYYGSVPVEVEAEVMKRIPDEFKEVIRYFYEEFPWNN